MTNQNVLIVGISGVTNGGKSTLTDSLIKKWSPHASIKSLQQDDYFYLEDSPFHVKCSGGVDHIDWELITGIDMKKMLSHIRESIDELMAVYSKQKKEFSERNASLSLFSNSTLENRLSNLITKNYDDASLNEGSTIDKSSIKSDSVIPIRPILLLDGFILYENSELVNVCDLKFFFTLDKNDCRKRRLTREYDPPDVPGYFDACVWPHYEEHLSFVKSTYPDTIFLDGLWSKEKVFSVVLEKILEATSSV